MYPVIVNVYQVLILSTLYTITDKCKIILIFVEKKIVQVLFYATSQDTGPSITVVTDVTFLCPKNKRQYRSYTYTRTFTNNKKICTPINNLHSKKKVLSSLYLHSKKKKFWVHQHIYMPLGSSCSCTCAQASHYHNGWRLQNEILLI